MKCMAVDLVVVVLLGSLVRYFGVGMYVRRLGIEKNNGLSSTYISLYMLDS